MEDTKRVEVRLLHLGDNLRSIRPDALVEYVPTGISTSQGVTVGTEWNRVEDKS